MKKMRKIEDIKKVRKMIRIKSKVWQRAKKKLFNRLKNNKTQNIYKDKKSLKEVKLLRIS